MYASEEYNTYISDNNKSREREGLKIETPDKLYNC